MNDLEKPIRVWDWPVRVFHWSLAACVFIAFFTGESERWRLWHQTLGYVAGGLLAFRLVWGFIGTRHARFASFIKSPQAFLTYVKSLRHDNPEHHVGHNPVGGLAVLLLMGMTAITVFSGWLLVGGAAPGWQEDLHEVAANTLMLLVGVHVLGVLLSSKQHKENLVCSMLNGLKSGPTAMEIHSSWWWLALVMVVAMAGFIWQQLQV
jgi:cytochrome b